MAKPEIDSWNGRKQKVCYQCRDKEYTVYSLSRWLSSRGE